jgi:hypothetical protein
MTKKTIMSPIVFTREEYDFLNKVSAEANLSVGEFIRYIVKGLKYGVELAENPKKAPSVIIGEYGYSITSEDFTAFTNDIQETFTKVIDKLETSKIKHHKGTIKPRFKKYKPMGKTA